MTDEATTQQSWKCHAGRHHFVVVADNNPENLKSNHRECTRCGKIKEIKEYEPSDGKYLAGGGLGM